MTSAAGPRRAATSAAVAVALTAGAASGLVAAEVERSMRIEPAATSAATPAVPLETSQATIDEAPSLTPAPPPQQAGTARTPHTTTRAS